MYRITTFAPDGSVRIFRESADLVEIGIACMFFEEVGIPFSLEEVRDE